MAMYAQAGGGLPDWFGRSSGVGSADTSQYGPSAAWSAGSQLPGGISRSPMEEGAAQLNPDMMQAMRGMMQGGQSMQNMAPPPGYQGASQGMGRRGMMGRGMPQQAQMGQGMPDFYGQFGRGANTLSMPDQGQYPQAQWSAGNAAPGGIPQSMADNPQVQGMSMPQGMGNMRDAYLRDMMSSMRAPRGRQEY